MKEEQLKKKCLNLFIQRHSINEIVNLVPGVSRKTIYNWRKEENWNDIKKANLTAGEKIESNLSELVLKLINTAKQNPDKQSFSNLANGLRIFDQHQKTLKAQKNQ